MRLIYGPGGAGKTRLSVQLIDLLSEQPDWIAGRLACRADNVDLGRLAKALAGRKVLLCLEDAEDWAHRLPELLANVTELDHRNLRILLLARTGGAWWNTLLQKAPHGRSRISQNPTELKQLGKESDPVEVLHRAYQDFRRVIFPSAPEKTPPVLINAAPGEVNVLNLHAAALAVVLHCRDNAGQPPQNTIDLRGPLGELLDHERNWWQMWIHSSEAIHELPDLKEFDERDFSNRVLIVPALYQTTDETQAKAALAGVLADRFGPKLVSRVAATLPKVYPNTRTGDVHRCWGPLRPDPLGEELVLEVLGEAMSQEQCNELVCAIFAAGVDEAQAEKALTVLARAAGLDASADAKRATTDTALARQRASDCIRALLEQYPDPFLLPAATTVAGGLSEPAPLIDIIKSTLRCAGGEVSRRAARLIPHTIPTLAPLEAALWQRCIKLTLEQSKNFTASQELDLAWQYHSLSDAHERANDSNAALVAVQSAVARYQRAVTGRADARAELASAQEALATREKDVGHQAEALDQITSAIRIYQGFVAEGEQRHLDLARAKAFKSQLLQDMGRHEEAEQELGESRKSATEHKEQL